MDKIRSIIFERGTFWPFDGRYAWHFVVTSYYCFGLSLIPQLQPYECKTACLTVLNKCISKVYNFSRSGLILSFCYDALFIFLPSSDLWTAFWIGIMRRHLIVKNRCDLCTVIRWPSNGRRALLNGLSFSFLLKRSHNYKTVRPCLP